MHKKKHVIGLQYFSEYFNNAKEDVLKLKYSQTLNDLNLFKSPNINSTSKTRLRLAVWNDRENIIKHS